jgi:Co/Zn/Cd efflux system component
MIDHLNILPCNLPSRKNQYLPNINYLWFLLSKTMVNLLSDGKQADKLTIKEIILKGTIISIIVIIPSLSTFFLFWWILDDLIQAIIIGGIVHFIAMGFSLKISRKFFTKKRIS